MRVTLVLGGRKCQGILLEQRERMQVRGNEAAVLDVPPFFMTRGMDWFAQVEGGISAGMYLHALKHQTSLCSIYCVLLPHAKYKGAVFLDGNTRTQ